MSLSQCGMPAAYTISIMSSGKGKWRKDEEKKDDDDYADDTDKQEEKGGEVRVTNPCLIIELARQM